MRALWSGIDTLEVSYRGTFIDHLCDFLRELKSEAQGLDRAIPVRGFTEDFVISPQGLKPWSWRLLNEDMDLRLSEAETIPNVSVRLSSLGLAAYGAEPLLARADGHIADLGHFESPAVSRLDLFADIQGFEPDAGVMAGIVCPAAYRGTHAAGSSIQTFQYGKGAIVARVYNKTAEIAVSGKAWLRGVWASCEGFEPDADVWRVEYQLRRDFLKELKFTEGRYPPAVFAHTGDLWATALAWCDLRVPNGENKTRWARHPAWEVLAEIAPDSVPHARIKSVSYSEGFEAVVPQIAGLLVSASSAVSMWDLDSAQQEMDRLVQEYIDERGVPFRDLVRRRTHQRLAGR